MQRSQDKPKDLNHETYGPLWAHVMFTFMTGQSETDWTSTDLMEGWLGKSSLSHPKNKQHCVERSMGLSNGVWTNLKTSRALAFRLTRPRWGCLVIMCQTMDGEIQIQHIRTNTPRSICQAWWWIINKYPQRQLCISICPQTSRNWSNVEKNTKPRDR